MSAPTLVEAAGGVLWRAADGGDPAAVEVALVHRPAYDDWSLPKGKLDPGEHPLLGALREIEEETGFTATPGRPLGVLRYELRGRPKQVRYWACRARPGSFTASTEVDEILWLPVDQAIRVLSADRDRPVLERFGAGPRDTRALVVVRHASAGGRDAWPGTDGDRPLDGRGRKQAEALVALLQAYDVRRAVTADLVRCRETLAPFATAAGLPVAVEEAVTAGSFQADPCAGVSFAVALAGGPPTVVCTQREVIADLVAGVCERLGRPTASEDVGPVAKGSMVVLHLDVDGPAPVMVAREWLPSGHGGTP